MSDYSRHQLADQATLVRNRVLGIIGRHLPAKAIIRDGQTYNIDRAAAATAPLANPAKALRLLDVIADWAAQPDAVIVAERDAGVGARDIVQRLIAAVAAEG